MTQGGSNFQAIQAHLASRERCAKAHEARGDLHIPFVTISRQAAAGGTTVARIVAEELTAEEGGECSWTVFDRNLVDAVIEKHDLPKEVAKFISEGKTSEIRDIIESLLELHPPAFALVKRTSETILHLAKLGHAVLIGRGANLVTRTLRGGLHVRLIGSFDKRVHHAEEFYRVSHDEAVKKVKAEDEGRRHYVRQNFAKDIDDPFLYDMVINTDRISYEDAGRIIADEVRRRKL